MLNHELQLQILKTLAATYIDERRIEISSSQYKAEQNIFTLNLIYLKKEKLIDLSSLNTRPLTILAINADEPETMKENASDNQIIARANITHQGMKALYAHLAIAIIEAR